MSVAELTAFMIKTYVDRDLTGFTGDPKYIEDDRAQKLYAKLRSSIGGLYQWRASQPESASQKERLLQEAEYAFGQAVALSPRNPEATYHFITCLMGQDRIDDSLLLAEVALKADPASVVFPHLAEQLRLMKSGRRPTAPETKPE
jgi:hypothetical protein